MVDAGSREVPLDHLQHATKIVLLFAAGMFLWALLLGTLKYAQILRSPDHRAHPYTDIAHRPPSSTASPSSSSASSYSSGSGASR
jgi:hypothetical protein